MLDLDLWRTEPALRAAWIALVAGLVAIGTRVIVLELWAHAPARPGDTLGVVTETPVLVALDLTGTFAFALNGALTAVRVAQVDIVGVLTLGIITALGGGIIRDILLGDLPPATFGDWRFLAVAAAGSLVAFLFSGRLGRFGTSIDVLDAAGLSLFAVTGASKAHELGLGPAQAIILGTVTAVGGGTVRDVLVRELPSVLSSGLYAVPAIVGAALTVAATGTSLSHVLGAPAALGAAGACFVIRLAGLYFGLEAPKPPGSARAR